MQDIKTLKFFDRSTCPIGSLLTQVGGPGATKFFIFEDGGTRYSVALNAKGDDPLYVSSARPDTIDYEITGGFAILVDRPSMTKDEAQHINPFQAFIWDDHTGFVLRHPTTHQPWFIGDDGKVVTIPGTDQVRAFPRWAVATVTDGTAKAIITYPRSAASSGSATSSFFQ